MSIPLENMHRNTNLNFYGQLMVLYSANDEFLFSVSDIWTMPI